MGDVDTFLIIGIITNHFSGGMWHSVTMAAITFCIMLRGKVMDL